MMTRVLWTAPVVIVASLVLASCGTAATPEVTPSAIATVASPTYVEVDDRTAQEQLTDAAKTDDVALAESAIAAGADVNYVMDNGNTALTIAITRDSLEMVSLLLTYDPILIDEETGWTILEVAAYFSGAEVIQALIDAGLHPDGLEPALGAPIAAAALRANNAAVAALIDAGADVNMILPSAPPGREGFTPLFPAAYSGDAETIRLLVDAGADIHHKNSDGYTALDWASSVGNEDTEAYLTELGA